MVTFVSSPNNKLFEFCNIFQLLNYEKIKTVIKKGINHILSIIIFHTDTQANKYRVLGDIPYRFNQHPYLYLEYMIVAHKKQSQHDTTFKDTNFNDISGMVITDFFMSIMLC